MYDPIQLSFCWLAVFAVLCVSSSGREDKNDVHHSMYNTMGYGLELLLTKFDIISSNLQRVEEKLQRVEDNLIIMEEKMQKTESKMLQIENNILEHRSIQENSEKELFAVLHKLGNQITVNLSNVYNRQLEKAHTTMHKLGSKLERVLESQYGTMPSSCKDVSSKYFRTSGTYLVRVKNDSEPFKVFCEQNAFDGGWIVFQFRFDGSLDFDRGWNEFRDGFGDLNKEFWLGLEKVHQITSGRKHEMIVELKDFNGTYRYARYDAFEISGESDQYRLKGLGNYSGTAGNAIFTNKDGKYSTKDRDNDDWELDHCAQTYKGAWWHKNFCTVANLNGRYINAISKNSMNWYFFKDDWQGLSYSRMMIRELE